MWILKKALMANPNHLPGPRPEPVRHDGHGAEWQEKIDATMDPTSKTVR